MGAMRSKEKSRFMEHDFRRRCEAALTHPVTLAALGALLVNDVVFKTLFPGAWAVGKLSDLAWVVFASPLMAFALSFAVPKSAAGRRATLIAAYGGLPLLYAAFNTFAPVHDAIMRVILIGADGAARGSPMDATDSLAIPFGLAIAAWIWRRGVPAGGRLRFRFAALAVCAAALACLASPCGSQQPVKGIVSFDVADDGAVLASHNFLPHVYRSYDGGMSWSGNDRFSLSDEATRAKYRIGDSGIEFIGEDKQWELVYSTEYLRGDANEWVQENDTREFGYRVLATRANHVLYHADSGNAIAAMGIQGAAVGTPDGRWRRVAVGDFSPTDFSFAAKTRSLMESGWRVGIVAATLSLSAMAMAAAMASAYAYGERIGGLFIAPVALVGCLGTILVIGAMNGAHLAIQFPALPAALMNVAHFLIPFLAFPAALLSLITVVVAVAETRASPGFRNKYAMLACVSTLPLSIGLLFSFGLPENNCCGGIAFAKFALFVAAFISLIPPLAYHARFIARRWRAFALAFLGMNALIALAFLLWIQMNVSLAATQAAIVGLVGLAAVVLVRHVRGGAEWG